MAGKLPNPPRSPSSDENQEYFEPRSPGEKRFWDKHVMKVHPLPDGYKPGPETKKDTTRKADKSPEDEKGEIGESAIVAEMRARLARLNEGDEEYVEEAYDWKSKQLSTGQKKKRDAIVASMKQKAPSLKAKYGDRWEHVMYATATKRALGEDAGQQAASDSSSGSGYSQSIHNQAPLPSNANGEPEPNDKGQDTSSMNSKELLEALAIMAAEIFDALPKKAELPGDMKQQLGQAINIVEKVAGFVNQGQDGDDDNEDTAQQDTQPGGGQTDPQGKMNGVSEAYDKSAADRSKVMRRDKKKHGHAFDDIAHKAAAKYGSEAAGRRVAGAIMWKNAARHGK